MAEGSGVISGSFDVAPLNKTRKIPDEAKITPPSAPFLSCLITVYKVLSRERRRVMYAMSLQNLLYYKRKKMSIKSLNNMTYLL